MSLFVHCLNKVPCPTLHLKAYGQKLPLLVDMVGLEPAQYVHPLSHLNKWDIGVTVKSPLIFLFKPARGQPRDITLYPMLVPASRDYGSLLVDTHYNGHPYKIKLYPRLVHCIKSFNSRLQGDKLSTMAGVKKRGQACLRVIHKLSKLSAWELGGFRLEVTVQVSPLSLSLSLSLSPVPILSIILLALYLSLSMSPVHVPCPIQLED